MKCDACDATSTRVLHTRHQGGRVLRARHCDACGHRWTTVEVKLEELTLLDKTMALARQFTATLGANHG